jgi:hypothetical protein
MGVMHGAHLRGPCFEAMIRCAATRLLPMERHYSARETRRGRVETTKRRWCHLQVGTRLGAPDETLRRFDHKIDLWGATGWDFLDRREGEWRCSKLLNVVRVASSN